jgi:hypothetical protein
MTEEHRFDCPELGFWNMTDAEMVASLQKDAAKGDTYAAACLRARGIDSPHTEPARFGTADSAAALAATIQQATEPRVTRIDFAPGHEDEAITERDVAAKLRLMKAAPKLLEACRQAEQWLQGWASAEPYISVLRAAIDEAEGRSPAAPTT